MEEGMDKESFLFSIREGKWFEVRGERALRSYAVKMKVISLQTGQTFIQSLWLSIDYESLCFSDYDPQDWLIVDDTFVHHSSSLYLFGDRTPHIDSIYDSETDELNEAKMRKAIFDYAEPGFITEDELSVMWDRVKYKQELGLDFLSYR